MRAEVLTKPERPITEGIPESIPDHLPPDITLPTTDDPKPKDSWWHVVDWLEKVAADPKHRGWTDGRFRRLSWFGLRRSYCALGYADKLGIYYGPNGLNGRGAKYLNLANYIAEANDEIGPQAAATRIRHALKLGLIS